MPKETRQSTTEQLRAVNSKERTFDFVASTFDLDSYGTRIDPNGWDFETFKKNPVMCLQHDDSGRTASNGLPVANVIPESIRVEGSFVVMRGIAPAEGTFPLADTVYSLVSQGFIRGVSVGFEPLEWEDVDEVGDDGLTTKVRIYRKQRLLEVSIVTIPSNDKALVLRAKKLNADVNVIRRLTEHVEDLLKKPEPIEKALGTIKVIVQSEDEAAFDEQAKEIEKHRSYFEKKQPVNKLSSSAMEKFFKRILKEEQPADEAKAWERMSSAIEAIEEKEEEVEKPAPEAEIKPSNPQPSEAPKTTPEAPVTLSLDVLGKLPHAISKACTDAVVKASQRGIPPSEWDALIDAAKGQVLMALLPNSK